jgi:hypothetical protein
MNKAKTMMNRSLIITLALILGSALQTNANPAPDSITLITEKNQTMSALLENRARMQETIAFMHEHISENAVFEMSMSNETMPKDAQGQNIQMSKADYINSFIQGAHFVDHYKVSIKTIDVQLSNDNKTAVSKEIMTEEGVSLNPNNLQEEGKPFISTTSCTTLHQLDGEKAISLKAQCHTDTSFLTAA